MVRLSSRAVWNLAYGDLDCRFRNSIIVVVSMHVNVLESIILDKISYGALGRTTGARHFRLSKSLVGSHRIMLACGDLHW